MQVRWRSVQDRRPQGVRRTWSGNPQTSPLIQPAPAIEQLPEELGRPDYLVVDTGDCSNDNLRRCEAAGLTPLIAMKRDAHHAPLLERFAPDPDQPLGDDPILRLQHRPATREGKGLYARRKTTSEPVFGVIKHVLGFRQSLPRGLTAVSGEWNPQGGPPGTRAGCTAEVKLRR